MWLLLNPSIANEEALDPTLRRCMGFTAAWGGTQMLVGNLYALVNTDPDALDWERERAIGPDNDANLVAMAKWADRIVVGWGAHAQAQRRVPDVATLLRGRQLECLGANADGSPKHPLYLPSSAELALWAT